MPQMAFKRRDKMQPLPPDFNSFAAWLSSAAAIGFVLSFVAENWQWFQAADRQVKALILIFISIAMNILSYVLTHDPKTLLDTNAIYMLFVGSLTTVIGSQAWHKFINKSGSDLSND
jgi:amino acid permease